MLNVLISLLASELTNIAFIEVFQVGGVYIRTNLPLEGGMFKSDCVPTPDIVCVILFTLTLEFKNPLLFSVLLAIDFK